MVPGWIQLWCDGTVASVISAHAAVTPTIPADGAVTMPPATGGAVATSSQQMVRSPRHPNRWCSRRVIPTDGAVATSSQHMPQSLSRQHRSRQSAAKAETALTATRDFPGWAGPWSDGTGTHVTPTHGAGPTSLCGASAVHRRP